MHESKRNSDPDPSTHRCGDRSYTDIEYSIDIHIFMHCCKLHVPSDRPVHMLTIYSISWTIEMAAKMEFN